MCDNDTTPPARDNSGTQPWRNVRADMDKPCEIKIGMHNWHQARLRDLTPEGFRLSLTDMPAEGTLLKIRLPGMAMLDAEVCWARDFEAGCKFANPLSPYVFEHLVRS